MFACERRDIVFDCGTLRVFRSDGDDANVWLPKMKYLNLECRPVSYAGSAKKNMSRR